MKYNKTYSSLQIVTLITLQLLIGWQILFEGISKLLNPSWSSIGFLSESKWIFSGFTKWILSNNEILKWVDLLNTWGLIAIGLGLILGLFCRIAAISGAILLLMYYLCNPPLIGLEYSTPSEGNYLIVNKTLIESAALVVIAVFSTHLNFGLESLFANRNTKQEDFREEVIQYDEIK